MATRVALDIGGPAQLDIVNARRGSRWYIPATLTFTEEDGIVAADITAATLALKREAEDDVDPVLSVEATVTVISEFVVLLEFEVPADETPDIDAGLYKWEFELESGNELADGWAPTAGNWRAVGRVVEREDGS